MRRVPPVAFPVVTLVVACALFGGMAAGLGQLKTETDFVDAVPEGPEVDAYRDLLQSLEGTRFVAIYQPSRGADLRSSAGFDALVQEQQHLTAGLERHFGSRIAYTLSAYEAMRQANYMFHKFVTAGNPPTEAYALPEDPVTWDEVRARALASSADVLARDGSSALYLAFLSAPDALEARADAKAIAAYLGAWDLVPQVRVTGAPEASGLLVATLAAEERNREDLRQWGAVSLVATSLVLLVVMRRPTSILAAALGLGAATLATFGLCGWLGVRVDFLTVFLAPMVAGIGMDYALHVLHAQERLMRVLAPRAALAQALRDTAPAIAASAGTTCAGLLVFLLVPAPLFRHIGLLSALAVVLGFVASMTLVPALRALVPQRPRRNRRDGIGGFVAGIGGASLRHPLLAAALVLVMVAPAAWVAIQHTRIETGTSDTELPADDPGLVLQKRIEAEYGSFQRAYLTVQGDIATPRVLDAMDHAMRAAPSLPLFQEATSITSLVQAHLATDEGVVDAAKGQARPDPLPQSVAETKQVLQELRSDPLWKSLVPFVLSSDDRFTVVAIRLAPWESHDELVVLRDALRLHAQALEDRLGSGYKVHAAGSPVNRAASLEQTGPDVLAVTLGVLAVVSVVLAGSWSVRPGGVGGALGCTAIVALAAIMLLATIPILDAVYDQMAAWGAPHNSASLTEMFLLAFAVTVCVGIDGAIHIVHRAWVVGDAVEALRDTGRAVTGTMVTTVAAFAPLAGLYFLQSKNLAILMAAGALYAWVLTLLVAPHVAGYVARRAKRRASLTVQT